MRRIHLGIAVAMLGLLTAVPAFAHARLTATEPAGDAAVAVLPDALRLHVPEGSEPAFSGLRVTAPDGTVLATGAPILATGDATTLVLPLRGWRSR
ncbi:copper resistance CopC family protein [Neoroseomonas lacus]|uniref:Copper resistance protein CopC n=1 Tax=Neoroseomonas lacus TaxID=287609 RepID=A0A917L502_9PROT|nr:hypothetical protein [Neoroseomonas lacus]GGJ42690.1 hypothetical protein GCM10011320_57910 [Neoroseomonas lacus]